MNHALFLFLSFTISSLITSRGLDKNVQNEPSGINTTYHETSHPGSTFQSTELSLLQPTLQNELSYTSVKIENLETSPLEEEIGFTIIPDTSELPILNPDLARRQTAKLRLNNGMEVLLISDPDTDQSAASVAVDVGSWDDPIEFPGMAHFCEHMLFMGTEKYPDENAFFSLLADYGGTTNAMTSSTKTVYMFSSQEEGFIGLLDRFAHFFIDPLFKPSNIAREMHAVDQEFAKSLENDGWRTLMILKESGNPDHPNKMFSCGNSETLSHIPQSALLDWHKKYYSATRMHVAIYSSLPLNELKKNMVASFGAIKEAPPVASVDPNIPLTSAQQRGHITYIKPIQNKQNLMLLWELPPEVSNDPNHSADLIAYVLKRGQKNSLYEKLKEEQLIDSLSIQTEEIGGKDHLLFEVSLDLTEKGMQEVDTVLLRVHQAIAQIRKVGIPNYLFEEKNTVAKLHYQYQSRQDAFSYIMKLGTTLSEEPMNTYPRAQLLGSEYNPKKIQAAITHLTPEKCAIFFLANPELSQIIPDKKEKWMGAEYAVRPIPSSWFNAWAHAEPHPQIKIPEPNPFVSARLDLVNDPALGKIPVLIAKNDLGTAYYARCPEYQTPEVCTRIHILSPELGPNARSQILASLYCDHLTDLLHPTLSAAVQAGFSTSIFSDRSRLHIKMDGFSQKMPILLQEILKEMPLHPPTPEQFAIYVSRLEKEYSNTEKDLAFRQAKGLLDSLINLDKISTTEKLNTLKTISYNDFLSFHKKLFEKTYIEALFSGNLSLKEAQSAWLDVMHALGKTPYPKEQHPQTKVAQLPPGPFSIYENTQVQGNAAILLIDEGFFSPTKRAVQEILLPPLKEAFFNELRTKQKTGYIALSDGIELENRLYQFFLVQSNSHQPEDLLYRFELFLEEFLQDFSDKISLNRFETLKTSAIASLENRYRNIRDKSALWDLLAFQYNADFFFIEKRIQGIKKLSYDSFVSLSKEFLSRSNHKRLAILMEGKLPHPFIYETTTPLQLSEIATYAPREERNQESAQVQNEEFIE